MQARWGHIINPPLLKSLSTKADDAKTVIIAPDELNSSVWVEN